MRSSARRNDERRAVAYLRTSTSEQQLGPAGQRREIERWAARRGVVVVAWFQEAVSGGAELSDRPVLLRALASLQEQDAGIFVAQTRDRLGRDPVLVGMLEREARSAGAVVRTADNRSDGDDDDDENAILQKGVEDLLSKVERVKIRKRTKLALAVKKARGERVGGIPYGSKLAADGVNLEPSAAEQTTIASARSLAAFGLSLSKVSAALAAAGAHNRAGKPFSKAALHHLLKRSAEPAAA